MREAIHVSKLRVFDSNVAVPSVQCQSGDRDVGKKGIDRCLSHIERLTWVEFIVLILSKSMYIESAVLEHGVV